MHWPEELKSVLWVAQFLIRIACMRIGGIGSWRLHLWRVGSYRVRWGGFCPRRRRTRWRVLVGLVWILRLVPSDSCWCCCFRSFYGVNKAVLVLLALAIAMMHFKFCERTAMAVFWAFLGGTDIKKIFYPILENIFSYHYPRDLDLPLLEKVKLHPWTLVTSFSPFFFTNFSSHWWILTGLPISIFW